MMAKRCEYAAELARVSTHWSTLNNPRQFMLRYAQVVRAYLGALLPEPFDADDAFQGFCLRMVEKGFRNADPKLGRFRYYLKKAVRNFALNYRRDHALPLADHDLSQIADNTENADQEWASQWRAVLLERAWRGLEAHQDQTGNHAYTVLRLAAEHPGENSSALASRVSTLIGKPYQASAFRKQLSRSRQLFGDLLRYEVAQTVDGAAPDAVSEELIEAGLMPYLGAGPRH